MTMTLDSFYKTLSDLGLEWSLDNHEQIRCEAGDCPILAVHKARFKDMTMGNEGWLEAARELGLSDAAAEDILDAADSRYSSIRTELLTACGF